MRASPSGGEESTSATLAGWRMPKSSSDVCSSGRTPPRAVVFVDEIEKALAGASGDTSGVSQSFLGTLLSFMQDQEAQGCLFLGPPGAAKSAVAKAAGTTAGIPTIAFDLSSMKASWSARAKGACVPRSLSSLPYRRVARCFWRPATPSPRLLPRSAAASRTRPSSSTCPMLPSEGRSGRSTCAVLSSPHGSPKRSIRR